MCAEDKEEDDRDGSNWNLRQLQGWEFGLLHFILLQLFEHKVRRFSVDIDLPNVDVEIEVEIKVKVEVELEADGTMFRFNFVLVSVVVIILIAALDIFVLLTLLTALRKRLIDSEIVVFGLCNISSLGLLRVFHHVEFLLNRRYFLCSRI